VTMESERTDSMDCLAIGDFLLPSKAFDNALEGDGLFKRYRSIQWRQGLDGSRAKFRDVVRRIETDGPKAYDVQSDIMEGIEAVEALFVHLCPVPAELIDRAVKLRYIMTARGGLENIDAEATKRKGIAVINCPEHNALAVAEYTVGFIISEMRNIARSYLALKGGTWREFYDNTPAIPELSDSRIGLIGFGTIGKLVAKRLLSFESRVLVCDPFVDPASIEAMGCVPAGLEELLRNCDVISLHGRLPKDAPPLIGGKELAIMKPNALLINTARAALIDMGALYEALQRKSIMGAALDVFPMEPLPDDYPFLRLDNLTITNHRAGDTLNSYIKAPELLLRKLHASLPMVTGR
jgi:D-3-phosphoglycerate dehydrogenase